MLGRITCRVIVGDGRGSAGIQDDQIALSTCGTHVRYDLLDIKKAGFSQKP